MQTFDVVIVGAGLVGASLALALGDADLSVAVVEPQARGAEPAEDTWDSRVYALSPGNARWLEGLGIWREIPQARAQRVERMRIFGDRAPAKIEFSAYDAGLRELAWIVEKFWAWTDCDGDPLSIFTREQLLDNVTVYWFAGTGASSARLYWESAGPAP